MDSTRKNDIEKALEQIQTLSSGQPIDENWLMDNDNKKSFEGMSLIHGCSTPA